MLHFPIYLDYNATTPCDPQVVEAMLPYFTTQFGNAASRQHALGWQAEEAVDYARQQVAALIGADATEIVFTSGATESNNLALKGVVEIYAAKGNHIITAVTEHKAVLDACKHLEKQGVQVTYLPVDEKGMISLQQLEAAITPATILIAIMYANNETGVIQPVQVIGRLAKQYGVLFFSDATQAVGKIPVNVQTDEIDIMSFSAHKMYGPKGVGACMCGVKIPGYGLPPRSMGAGMNGACAAAPSMYPVSWVWAGRPNFAGSNCRPPVQPLACCATSWKGLYCNWRVLRSTATSSSACHM